MEVIIGDGADKPKDDLLKEIENKERACLEKILTRYCILKNVVFDMGRIDPREHPGKSNYWEYWYEHGNTSEFLMSRELKLIDGVVTLEIKFNPMLLDETNEIVK